MAEFQDLIVGNWNDPHMLAACIASLWYLRDKARNKDDGKTLFKGRHRPWMYYAIDSEIGTEHGPTIDGARYGTGFVALSDPIAHEIVRVHRLMREMEQGRARGVSVRIGVKVKPAMLVELNGSYPISRTTMLPWLVRTWVYIDVVAPWRGVTEDAIKHPRNAKPLPSRVPADVALAVEACLEANEPDAARQYYNSWRRAQLEAREDKTT